MSVLFYTAGAVAVGATAMVITRSRAIHALLYLVVSLLAVALAFYALGASFAAALEVIIYAGAIMVLFVFAVMLLNLGREAARQEKELLRPRAWMVPTILVVILTVEFVVMIVLGTPNGAGPGVAAATPGIAGATSPKQVGIALFGGYLVGVELASMLLMAGLVVAHHLTAGRRAGEQAGRRLRRRAEVGGRSRSRADAGHPRADEGEP